MIVTLRTQIAPDAEVEIEVGDEVRLGRSDEPGRVVSVEVRGRTLIVEVEVPDDHPFALALQDTQLRVSLGPSTNSTSTWNPSGAKRRLGR